MTHSMPMGRKTVLSSTLTANPGFQEEISPSATTVDLKVPTVCGTGRQLQVAWPAHHQQPKLARKHISHCQEVTAAALFHQVTEESQPYSGLQRSCGERPHQWYNCVEWKHHTKGEENPPEDY